MIDSEMKWQSHIDLVYTKFCICTQPAFVWY